MVFEVDYKDERFWLSLEMGMRHLFPSRAETMHIIT